MIPLFIGGTGRSGTTIMLEYLSKNPLVYASNPPELRILTEQYGLLDLYKTEDLESFLFYLEDHWLKETDKTFGIYSNASVEKIQVAKNNLINNFYKNKKIAINEFYKSLFLNQNNFDDSCLYYGDSTPSNLKYADSIFKVFEDCKFINMIRDGRDAAYSIFQMKNFWALEKRQSELDALDWWYNRIVESFEALSKIPSNYYLNARIEDFILNSQEKERVLSFLSLYENNEMKEFFNKNISSENTTFKKWQQLEIANKIDNKYSFMLKKLEDKGIFIERYY